MRGSVAGDGRPCRGASESSTRKKGRGHGSLIVFVSAPCW